jgi:hypothetical protein
VGVLSGCKSKRRFPAGMTNKTCKGKRRFPSGMTNKNKQRQKQIPRSASLRAGSSGMTNGRTGNGKSKSRSFAALRMTRGGVMTISGIEAGVAGHDTFGEGRKSRKVE